MHLDELAELVGDAGLIALDDRGVRDRQAERPLEQRDHRVPVGEPADGRGFCEGRDEAEHGMHWQKPFRNDEQGKRRGQHQRRQRLDAAKLRRAFGVTGGVEGEGSGRGHHCITLLVIASEAKQSRVFPRRRTGLLRFARNDGSAKTKARRSGPQISVCTQGAVSGGLGVDLGKVVLSGLRTVGSELADIVGGRLGARDEDFAAGAEQARLDLDGFADRLGGRELVDAREERLGVLIDRLLDVAADLAGLGDGLGHRVLDGGGHALGASEHLGSTVLGGVGGLLDELAGGLGNFQVLDVLESVLEALEGSVGFGGHGVLSILIGLSYGLTPSSLARGTAYMT